MSQAGKSTLAGAISPCQRFSTETKPPLLSIILQRSRLYGAHYERQIRKYAANIKHAEHTGKWQRFYLH